MPAPCSKDTISVYQDCKNTCILLQRESRALSAKAVGSINVLENTVQDKGVHGFSSCVLQKFEKSEGPTAITSSNIHFSFLHHLDFWQFLHECTTLSVTLIDLTNRGWTKSVLFVS